MWDLRHADWVSSTRGSHQKILEELWDRHISKTTTHTLDDWFSFIVKSFGLVKLCRIACHFFEADCLWPCPVRKHHGAGLKSKRGQWWVYFRNPEKCKIFSSSSSVKEYLPSTCCKFNYGEQIMRVGTVLSKPCVMPLWRGLRVVIDFSHGARYVAWCAVTTQRLIWALAEHLELLCTANTQHI